MKFNAEADQLARVAFERDHFYHNYMWMSSEFDTVTCDIAWQKCRRVACFGIRILDQFLKKLKEKNITMYFYLVNCIESSMAISRFRKISSSLVDYVVLSSS